MRTFVRSLRIVLAGCAAAAAASFTISAAVAQGKYPERPVRIIVPFNAGGVTDAVARVYTRELAARLGQPFVLENRPGSSTNIAAATVAHAPPDGYTLLISTIASNALNKWTYRKLAFDPDKFEDIGLLGLLPSFMVVGPESPYRSVADLVAAARASRDGLSYGSHGNGGANHLVTELFRRHAGIKQLLHVPYKGSGESSVDLIEGRIDFMIDGAAINQVKAGRMRALAVAFPERWPTQPDLPTMAEAGYPDVTMTTFFGLAAPPGTPAEILDRLNAILVEVARDPAIRARLLELNVLPKPASRAETTAFIRAQSEKWGPVLKSLDIHFD